MTRCAKDTRVSRSAAPAKIRSLIRRLLGFQRTAECQPSRALDEVTQRVPRGAENVNIGRSQAASISSAFAGRSPHTSTQGPVIGAHLGVVSLTPLPAGSARPARIS